MGNDDYISVFNLIVSLLSNIWKVVLLIFGSIYLLWSVFGTRNRSSKYTKEKIDEFKRNGKYIPGIFVELNESKEVLRYFIYGEQWKKRIIDKFNFLYKNSYGDILRKVNTEKDTYFYLDNWTKLDKVEYAIDVALDYHQRLQKRKVRFQEEYAESLFLLEYLSWPYMEALEELQNFAYAANRNYLVLTGSAGNGKTNLLCSIAELAIKLDYSVLFLNSRDIKGDIVNYVLSCLNVHGFLTKCKSLYFWIVNLVLSIKGEKCIIFIDAINENDEKDYGERVQHFINYMRQFGQFKIVVSCRNEYYQVRFAKYLSENIKQKHLVYEVKKKPYTEVAVRRIIRKYRDYFNYTGYISDNVLHVLCDHLLLLRIFFELHRNSDENVLSIQKHELFSAYINRVKTTTSPNIELILMSIADAMLRDMNFDSVDLELLKDISKNDLFKTFDETVLLSKKLCTHEGTIASNEKEVVYFVFDELRDYCIARHIMQSHAKAASVDGEEIIRILHTLRNNQVSCEEGIMHYSYVFFKTDKSFSREACDGYCRKILDFYRLPEGYQYSYFKRRNRSAFANYGLKIILMTGQPLTEFEKEFILDYLCRCPEEDGNQIFVNALYGTLDGMVFDLAIYLELLFTLENVNEIYNVVKTMVSDNLDSENDLPYELAYWHKQTIEKCPDKALQIQEVAEVYLLMSKNDITAKKYEMEDYFFLLPGHEEILKKIRIQLKNVKQRGVKNG